MQINSAMSSSGMSNWQVIALLLCWTALWAIVRPYDGLVHDAQLYSLQALATLRPDVFAGDLFLRFGSQNDFTLFPKVFGLAAGVLGLERSAALLTLVFSLAWLVAAWRIALILLGRDQSILSLGMLVAVKAWYGSYQVFRAGESFLSGRLPAEVVALAAIAAYLGGKRALAVLLVLTAGTLHPLMALPVALWIAFMYLHERLGGRALTVALPLLLAGGMVGTLVLSGNPAADTLAWIQAMRTRNIFLFTEQWRLEDWQHHLLMLASLGLACSASHSSMVRRYSATMMLLGGTSVGLAIIAGYLAEHSTLLMSQPYRWIWPAIVSAIMLVPATATSLWNSVGSLKNRICAILLIAAWINMETVGGFLALAALCLHAWRGRAPSDTVLRALHAGAWTLLVASVCFTAIAIWQTASFPLDTGFDPVWVQRMVNGLPTNPTALAAMLFCWLIIGAIGRHRSTSLVIVILVAVLVALLMPRVHRTWTKERFDGGAYNALAEWRSIMPPTAEVLWPTNPTGIWILLERRSYMSAEQTAGLLYSPRMVTEMHRRTRALQSYVGPGWWTLVTPSKEFGPKTLTPQLLNEICHSAPDLDYVVSGAGFHGFTAQALLPVDKVTIYLYACSTVRSRGV